MMFDLDGSFIHVDDPVGGFEEVAVAITVGISEWLIFDTDWCGLLQGAVPDETPELVPVAGEIIAELAFELADLRDGVLEGIFPGVEGFRIDLGGHGGGVDMGRGSGKAGNVVVVVGAGGGPQERESFEVGLSSQQQQG